MRGSSFTTFLMFLPLVAIPLLAIFGIPEFTPVNASSPSGPGHDEVFVSNLESASGRNDQSKTNNDLRDLFRSPDDDAAAAAAEKNSFEGRNLGEWQLDPRDDRPQDGPQHQRPRPRPRTESRVAGDSIAGNPFEELNTQPVATRNPVPRRTTPQPTAAPAARDAMTWQRAVARLNGYGIKEFALMPGNGPDEFHFSCNYAPPDNPRVIHRFEAEDADPLQAVQKVLRQIEVRLASR